MKQAESALKKNLINGVGYCCLGIGTQCYIESTEGKKNKAKWIKITDFDCYCGFESQEGKIRDTSSAYLPSEVREYFGFTRKNPVVILEDGTKKMASECNDDLNMSFKEIADAFERTYLTKKKKV